MQLFTFETVDADKLGDSIGYWSRSISTKKGSYLVSIVRDSEGLFTVSSTSQNQHCATDDTAHFHLAGHVAHLEEAVNLANITVDKLRKYDLFVTIGNNGVGAKVLVTR